MNPASPIFAVLSIAGTVVTVAGGAILWFKLGPEIRKLRAEVATLRTEVELVRTRYWRAIAHIRALATWIHRHHTDPVGLPVPAVEIANDI